MDEAERCHRLAILDHGRLVADGTPGELAAQLDGRTVVVHATQPRHAHQALLGVPGVLSVAQVGNSLRVLGQAGADIVDSVRVGLRDAGVEAQVEAAPPDLEDVFVAATQHGDDDSERVRARPGRGK
jgi:ABC-2 type transport system ATP-binding protein